MKHKVDTKVVIRPGIPIGKKFYEEEGRVNHVIYTEDKHRHANQLLIIKRLGHGGRTYKLQTLSGREVGGLFTDEMVTLPYTKEEAFTALVRGEIDETTYKELK